MGGAATLPQATGPRRRRATWRCRLSRRATRSRARCLPHGPRVPGSGGAERLALRKVACAIRELDTFEGVLEFRARRAFGGKRVVGLRALCSVHDRAHPELSRCAVKFIDDRERAENEWFHLTTYRSPLFPAPFLFGRVVSQGADASASLVAVRRPRHVGRRWAGVRRPRRGSVAARLRRSAHLRGALCHRDGAHRGSDARAAHRAGLRRDAGAAPVEKALEIAESLRRVVQGALAVVPGLRSPRRQAGEHHRGRRSVQDAPGRSGCLRPRAGSSAAQARGAPRPVRPLEIERPQDYPAESPVSYCDARIDTYSIAATFYALLTGAPACRLQCAAAGGRPSSRCRDA